MARTARPIGVAVLGLVLVIAPIAGFVSLAALAFPRTPLSALWAVNPSGREALEHHPVLIGIVLVVIPLAFAAGVGLLLMRSWGRRLAMTLLAVNGVGDMIAIRMDVPRGVAGVLVATALLIYLGRPKLRDAFEEEARR